MGDRNRIEREATQRRDEKDGGKYCKRSKIEDGG